MGVLGAIVFALPMRCGTVTNGPSILVLSLMFREGPTVHAIVTSA